MRTVLPASWGRCCGDLQWTADSRILYTTGFGLRSVPVKGSKSKRLLFGGCPNPHGCQVAGGFILSPDREYAATEIGSDFSDPNYGWGIGLVELKTGGPPKTLPTALTAEEAASPVIDTALAFSPDGKQLVFSRTPGDPAFVSGPPTLRAISVAGGSGSVPLAQSGIPGASLVPDDAEAVEWSPDGSWVAYVEDDYANPRLEVVATTGTDTPRSLATCDWYLSFSWSPTSKRIAYSCESESGPIGFGTVAPDGTNATNLHKGHHLSFFPYSPQWSPDGSHLLFLARRYGPIVHAWTIRPDGSHVVRVG